MTQAVIVGNDDFEDIIEAKAYYVDKTLLIKGLIDSLGGSKVNIFTRPRRFGRTLALSAINYFFEDTHDPDKNEKRRRLFDGLKISQCGDHYTSQMTSRPVINISFKDLESETWKDFNCNFRYIIGNLYKRHSNLLEQIEFNEDKELFIRFQDRQAKNCELHLAFRFLIDVIKSVTGKSTIVLIDEYDVPINSAISANYYPGMRRFMSQLFTSTFSNNKNLYFAALTGCFGISSESLFSGLSWATVNNILSPSFKDSFGFTETEVKEMLSFYHLDEHFEIIKEWYGGYAIPGAELYNPWSIGNYVRDNSNAKAFPKTYWSNTNDRILIESFDRYGESLMASFQDLINGKTIKSPISENVSYVNAYDTPYKFWSFLLFNGYLTVVAQDEERNFELKIPNLEIRELFRMISEKRSEIPTISLDFSNSWF
ncbi:MAG: AAA family ATPase [Clostridiales bacterium]|nr:AAA family ATPase [Clostridiales bacterium]